jgi:hypothetical protein
VDDHLKPGHKLLNRDGKDDSGKDVRSAIYLHQLRVGGLTESRRMLLIK